MPWQISPGQNYSGKCSAPDAQKVITLVKAAGRKADAIPCDLREEAFCELVAAAVNALGGLLL